MIVCDGTYYSLPQRNGFFGMGGGAYSFKLSLQIVRMSLHVYKPCNFNGLAEVTILIGLVKPDM
jgi:hypothetical protein